MSEQVPPNKEERLRACMRRLGDRYKVAIDRMDRHTPPAYLSGEEFEFMTSRRRLRDWFEDRMGYLQDEYRIAINNADNIIGKQRLYDHTLRQTKLPPR